MMSGQVPVFESSHKPDRPGQENNCLAYEIYSTCSKSGVTSQLYVKKNVKNTDFGLVCQKVNREVWTTDFVRQAV